MKTLQDLFMHQLKDIYYAEQQILKALPEMVKSAKSEKLRKAFETHLEETKGQVERLDKVFSLCGAKAEGQTCPAIQGIIKEHKEIAQEVSDPEAMDAALAADAQAVEHYEISRYGTLIAWAKQLGLPGDVARLLGETLKQEYHADEVLSEVAEQQLNKKAA
jgi:ferritin-like metal-binding protein YciE